MSDTFNPYDTNARLQAEVDRLRAELEAAKVEPPRPAAMLWTDATEWHAYERWEDADRERYARAKQPPLMVVKSWTWHPRKEDTDGIADHAAGG